MNWEWEIIFRGENKYSREENKSRGFKVGEIGFFILVVVIMFEVFLFWKIEIYIMFMLMLLV